MSSPIRYINNAKELLKRSKIEGGYYTDLKYVRSAFGVLYLGILKAVDDFLLKRGVEEKSLPKRIEEYVKCFKGYGSPYDGKLIKEFESLYKEVHIAGYYRGLLSSVKVIKDIFEESEKFIKKLSR
jgi:hypothetical protein